MMVKFQNILLTDLRVTWQPSSVRGNCILSLINFFTLLFTSSSFLVGRNENLISSSHDLSVALNLVCSPTTRPLLVLRGEPVLYREERRREEGEEGRGGEERRREEGEEGRGGERGGR